MQVQNDMIRKQLNHRTIREFRQEPVPQDIIEQLIAVAARTATSTGMQACSVINVTAPTIKKEIADVCNQDYVSRAPLLFIFIADQYRNRQIALASNYDAKAARDMDRFFQSFTDACLMAQNVVNAAEALELGTVYLGSILNDSEKICDILKLPELTFPVLGLGIGYPGQNPQLKPRMNMSFRVFENTYIQFENYLALIKDYDEEMQTYYDLRDTNRRSDSFSNQVVARYNSINPKRQKILEVISRQGFTG
jgi:nitroreductase